MATIVPTTFSGSLSGTLGTVNAGDIIVIPSDSSVAYTSGLDLSAVEIGGFYISKNCTSTFGSASAGGVLIDTGGGNTILLAGVAIADLDNSDFIF